MVEALIGGGHLVEVVTTPPYYPHWRVQQPYSCLRYTRCGPGNDSKQLPSDTGGSRTGLGTLQITRCPLWVPRKVTGLKRVVHLASFGLSSIPVVLWKAIRMRPDVIITVEPAAFCMPTTLLAARLCGAKAWLHVQDLEVDAAFELGILKQPTLQKIVLSLESFLMRRFDRVSSISPNMLLRLFKKGVAEDRLIAFPNWVDCDLMCPLSRHQDQLRSQFGIPTDKCIALYSGNIGAKQGLEVIINAARQCIDNSLLHFVICGRGAAYESFREASRGLGNIQWLPLQPLERFNELMNCADMHLLPQRADAADLVMPSKLTGMLATGRPVVACADRGTQIADVVNHHGLVVPPGDATAFYIAVLELASNRAQRESLGAAARQYAVRNFSRNAILNQFIVDLTVVCGASHKQSLTRASIAPAPRDS